MVRLGNLIPKRWTDALGGAVDALLPGICIGCRFPSEGGRFCDACDRLLRALEDRPQCDACGAPVAQLGMPCQRCLGRGYRLFEQVTNNGIYAPPLRGLIHRLKFYHSWTIAELLAERAMRQPHIARLMEQADVLVPVPLHGWRQITRGFNQSEVIARQLAKRSRAKVRYPAIRIRRTQPQSRVSRREKTENLRNAFALVKPKCIAGKRIVLIDDVMTTGITLKTLARVLQPACPESISVFTLALADPRGHSFEAV